MKVGLNNLAGLLRSFGHPARNLVRAWHPPREPFPRLFHVEQLGGFASIIEGKEGRGLVALLLVTL